MKFKLGNVVATRAAKDQIPLETVQMALARHQRGDWGEVSDDDKAANDEAVKSKEQIISVYDYLCAPKFWIITDAGHETTTVLLPSDY